jgi:sec-independent protein translocase protein TatA
MPSEWIIVLIVGLLLLFSAKKLPDMARGLGQSMRIFRAETRGLKDDEAQRQAAPRVEGAPAQTPTTAASTTAAPATPAPATPTVNQTVAPAPAPVQGPAQAPVQDTTPDAPRPGTTAS